MSRAVPSDYPSRCTCWVESSRYFRVPVDDFIKLGIQDLGRVDRIILQMEKQLVEARSSTTEDQLQHSLWLTDCSALSVLWIYGLYEVLRTARQADKTQFEPLADLFKQLEIIRMPLAKHEVKRTPEYQGVWHYPQPLFVPSTGWVAWNVFDPNTKAMEQIARTELADQFLRITAMS